MISAENTIKQITCTDYETATACWTSAIREQKVNRIFSDHTSINRFDVSEAILKCLQLIETCHGKDSILYGYNTDGIYITNPKKDVKE